MVDLDISYSAEFYAELFVVIHKVMHKRIYNSIIMQFDPAAFISLLIGLASLITTAGLGVRWLTRHYFDEIKKELKPNSGSSLKDQVSRLEKEMQEAQEQRKETNRKIDHIYEILIDYIASNKK